jgi:transposase
MLESARTRSVLYRCRRSRKNPFHDRFKGTGNGSQDGAVRVHQAYRFALDPTSRQERALRSHAGASRFAWNWGLAKCQQRYAAEGRWYSAVDLHKLWNFEKKADPALSWWGENSKCTYQETFRDLDRALRDFVKSRKGERKGPSLGFPRYKKRGKCRDSFRLAGDRVRCCGKTVTLTRIGTIATTSPRANSPADWITAPHASCRPRCPEPLSDGSSRSLWR